VLKAVRNVIFSINANQMR